MIRTLLKLLVLLIVGLLVYNYFFGTPHEKANSRKIFNSVKEVGVEVGELLKSEKEKFDKGKYDDALAKIEDIFGDLKDKAREMDKEYLPKIEELEKQRKTLQEKIDTMDDQTENKDKTDSLKNDLDRLLDETKNLMEDMKLKDQ